jgi:hypothetical protein
MVLPNKSMKKKLDIVTKKVNSMTLKKKKTNKKPISRKKATIMTPQIMKALSTQKKQSIQHILNIMDPWSAVDAKLPQIGENYSNTAKVKSYFNLACNATGRLFLYADLNYVNSASGGNTAFTFNSDSSLNGSTVLTGATYTGGPTNSVPTPPSTTVLKTRLVSAAMKVTPKASSQTYVGTLVSCVDYGDYNLLAQGAVTATQVSNVTQYTAFANILNGNGGKKYDLFNPGQSVYFNWYPVDPLSDVFIDAGNYIVDNNAKDAGGSPRFVCALQDFPAGTPVDIEIVWNIEYLSSPVAKPWLGYTQPVGMKEFDNIMQNITSDMYIHDQQNHKGALYKAFNEGTVNGYVQKDFREQLDGMFRNN